MVRCLLELGASVSAQRIVPWLQSELIKKLGTMHTCDEGDYEVHSCELLIKWFRFSCNC